AGPGTEASRQLRETLAGFEAGPADTARELAIHRGSYSAIVADKFGNELFTPLVMVVSNIGETLALMLLGMAFYKTGFILGEKPASAYRKWAFFGIGIGGASFVALGLWVWNTGFDLLDTMTTALALTIPGRLPMTIGYAAALILLIRRFAGGAF